ncbi:hypothetical protein GCM10022251_54880 [Phytohabitans flavus]|uniref:DUF302 domain-containing protein n=1 Tax=Phytohabitans flavus TaxID=1076124 RepID=A0A6F8XQ14_9ACTN|nr:hypothetical protein [Phytohabitans flavus]BCB75906.1 hypothetical protein Pflav_023160 [Phytohabitans flavus]
MATGPISDTTYQTHRLEVSVDVPFDEFRRRFETAVPAIDDATLDALVGRKADWSEMTTFVDGSAPQGFLRYWTSNPGPLMSLAGDPGECAAYLMGNHIIAERMYRYDPAAMMYAPLRPVISQRDGGPTKFTIERPGAAFASFSDGRIAEVGVELDRKVAALLQHLGAPVPPSLLE